MFFWEQLLARVRSRDLTGWPEAKGVVENADWDYGGRESAVPVATLAYSYSVAGERYSGYYRESFPDPASATKFVDHSRGRSMTVRYKKGNPARSFLLSEAE